MRKFSLERLEARKLLAADLVAQWRANELAADLEDGQLVSEWVDSVSGISARSTGNPQLVADGLGNRPVVRFDAADGRDSFQVSSSDSPLSGADDFSVAVLFVTNSSNLHGGSETWNEGTGLVHANNLGIAKDWGITVNATGQLAAGIGGGFGRPVTSVFTTQDGFNDGLSHVVIFTRAAGQISMYVDGADAVTQNGGDPDSRDRLAIEFGVGQTQGEYSGDIAEIRVYKGSLDADEAAELQREITAYYDNQPPRAVDDAYLVPEDGFLVIRAADGVLRNDIDPEGEVLRAELVTPTTHGDLALSPDGSLLYSPPRDFTGVVTFTYTAVDFRPSNVATVSIEVSSMYDPAVGVADSYKALPDGVLTIDASQGVLANDRNIDGLDLTAVLEDAVGFGELELHPDGSFSFDPQGVSGSTQFTYRINDTVATSAPATVELIVNSPPVAMDDRYEVPEDGSRQVPASEGLLSNDSDREAGPLLLSLIDQPEHADVAVRNDGSLLISPAADYFGEDHFTYQIIDGIDSSRIATVVLDILPVNDPPVAVDNAYYVQGDGEFVVPAERGVLFNDFDIDDTTLSAEIVRPPEHGEFRLHADGSFSYTAAPGFAETDSFTYRVMDSSGDSDVAEVSLYVEVSPIVISEFMAANATRLLTATRLTVEDRFPREKESPDWIELRNQSPVAFDLSGFYLTDDAEDLTRWRLPDGTQIDADGYLLVFASGKDIVDPELDENAILHTNFKLNADGDYVAVVSPDGIVMDDLGPVFPRQVADVSYGWVGDELLYMPEPSPGADATAGLPGIAEAAGVSVAAGYHDAPIQVEIAPGTAGSTVRYTLDGSEPTLTHGFEYATPIAIDSTTTLRTRAFLDGLLPSSVSSHSYLFLDEVLTQPEAPEGFPATWGAAGRADYEIDPRIATDQESRYYDADLRAALNSHPSISIVTEMDHLFDRSTGIYSNPQREGVAWERPASMEYFSSDGQLELQINAGLRIQGGASRNPNRPKHNMRLLFKEQYGASKLEYPLFEDSDVDRYDTIILRGGNGDSWFHPNATQQRQAQYIRDQWHRDTQKAMGRMTTEQRYVHLYINGLYWGLYHTFEKPNAAFFAEHFGGEPEEYDVLQHQNGIVDGNRDAWNEMMSIARGDVETAEAYAQIGEYMDIPALIDYLLINFYSGNVDWDQNNWFGGRKRDGGQWRFFTWDAERTFLGTRDDRTSVRNGNQPSDLHQRLAQNEEYRLLFADHVHRHFFNDGVLTPESAEARWMARADEIELPLTAEAARWGDNKRPTRPYTPDEEWKTELERLRNTYFPTRTDTVLDRIQRRDLYPDVAAPSFNQHGGDIDPGFQLTIEAPEGTIYVTTDGRDPRLAGGELAPQAIPYADAIVLSSDTTVKARVLHQGEWSALNAAVFLTPLVAASADSLRISEIHFNPAGPSAEEIAAGFDDNDDFEFIELVNISDASIDLSQVTLDRVDNQGVEFDFAQAAITRLAPNQRVLVVEDVAAFAARYGSGLPVVGQWQGRLGNAGESITLSAGDEVIHEFAYDDVWFAEADGQGSSLEIIDATHVDLNRWALATSWQASDVSGGTPGQGSPSRVPGDSTGDGVFDSSDLVAVFRAGEYEDGVPGNSTLAEGDWNRDGDFDSADLVFAFRTGAYVAAARRGILFELDEVAAALVVPPQRRWSTTQAAADEQPVWERQARQILDPAFVDTLFEEDQQTMLAESNIGADPLDDTKLVVQEFERTVRGFSL